MKAVFLNHLTPAQATVSPSETIQAFCRDHTPAEVKEVLWELFAAAAINGGFAENENLCLFGKQPRTEEEITSLLDQLIDLVEAVHIAANRVGGVPCLKLEGETGDE